MFNLSLNTILKFVAWIERQLETYIAKEQAHAQGLTQLIADLEDQKADKLSKIEQAARIKANVGAITK